MKKVVVDNAEDLGVRIVALDTARQSQVPETLLSIAANLPAGSFLLINDSDAPIMAVVVTWSFGDAEGNQQQLRIICDGYILSPVQKIVSERDLSLITPHGCTRQDIFPALAGGAVFGSTLDSPRQHAGTQNATSDIHIQIDSVIFGDGAISGPDQYQYYRTIQERESAIQAILKEFDATQGESLSSRITKVTHNLENSPDSASAQKRYWRGVLQRSPNPAGTIDSMKRRASLPRFQHRKGQSQ